MSRRPGAALVLGGLLAALVVAGEVVPVPGNRPATLPTTPVLATQVVCPDVRQTPPLLRTRISAGAPAGGAGPGRADARALSSRSAPVPLAPRASGLVAVGLAQQLDGDALLVRAQGGLAAGLEVEQVTRGTSGSQRGLAALRCDAPQTDQWFVGGSTRVGEAATLLLANPDDTPAVVDVEVLTADGPVDTRPGRGIAVGGRARTAVALDRLAPDHDLLAVHVHATRGRVAAAVRHARFDGRTPRGVDWVPPAGPPARTVLVPGLPSGPGRRTVLIANPGPDDTVVSVQLATADGLVVPAGLEQVPVLAGTTIAQDISALLATSPAAVRVVSRDAPVLASGLVVDARFLGDRPVGPVRELAWTGAARPLAGPALVTDVVLDRPTESTLLLTAFDADASVRVTPVPIAGREGAALPAARDVRIAAGRTVALRLSGFLARGATGRIAVEVRPLPGSGAVVGARYLREGRDDGPLSTLLVLRSGTPPVRPPVVVVDPVIGAG